MSILKKVLFVLLIVVLLLAIVGGIVYYLATRDDNKGKYEADPSSDLIMKGIIAAGTGKEISIEQDELNSFLAYVFEKREENAQSGFTMHSLYLALGEQEGDTGIYAPCTYKGIDIGVTARVTVTFDAASQQMEVKFLQLKAGRVNVPPKWGLSFIQSKLPQGVTVKEDTLFIDESLLQINVEQLDTPLKLKSFRINGGKVYLKTTGMMEAIERYLKEKLGDTLGSNNQILNSLVENFGNLFQNFLSGLQQ